MELLLRDTLVEVNLDNIIFNIKNIKKMVGEKVAIAAVVKANGYGHGAVGIAQTLMENGADYLGVATLTEALNIRRKFNDYKIFIMGFTPDEYLDHVVKNNITQAIFSYRQAEVLNELGIKYNKMPIIHIKYDTGFNRLGFKDCDESINEIEQIFRLKNINIEGIFSHFALAGREEDEKQYNRFIRVIERLEKKGIVFKYKHIEDGITAVDYPEYRMNMIRPGSILYGIKSFEYGSLDLKQVLTFKTKLSYVKTIPKGEGISYSYMWRAEKDSIIGTIPVGYADGYPRNLRDKGFVTVHGKKAPIVGVICMDQCMIDLTHIPEAREGDEVIIYGDGTNNTLDIHNAALLLDTNKNEIISRLTMRPPRVYIKNNKIVDIVNYI